MRIPSILLFLVALALAKAEDLLDTTRPAKVLSHDNIYRPTGFVYWDKVTTTTAFLVDIAMGVRLPVTNTFTIENEMLLETTKTGGHHIAITNQRAFVETSGLGHLHCELGTLAHKFQQLCAPYVPILKAANSTDSLVLDKEGKLLEITSSNKELEKMMRENSEKEAQKTSDQATPPPKTLKNGLHDQLQHSGKLMRIIPVRAVKPGDKWPVEKGEEVETLEGWAQLKGYLSYKGSDCAVFQVKGEIHVDLKALSAKKGIAMDPSMEDHVNANVTEVIYWDYSTAIARWHQTNSSMLIRDMHTNETTTVETSIVRKLSDSSGRSGARMWSIFLVGVVAVAALLAVKKRRPFLETLSSSFARPDTTASTTGGNHDQELVPMAENQASLL